MNEPAPTNSIYLGSTRNQHKELVAQSAVVLKLGLLLMKSGASAYRVKTSMSRLAKAVGLEEHHAQVHFTELSTTAYSGGNFRTEIAETRVKGISAYKIDLLSDFVSSLPERIDPALADATLTRIEKEKPLYAPLLLALAAALACAAFAFLNQGGVIECSVVLVAAFAGQLLRSTLAHRGLNHMAVWMLCGLLSAGIYVGVMSALIAPGLIADNHLVGFISSILYLVPGFPLVTGMLEIARMDFSSGISRLTYVALLLGSASFSVWLISLVFSLPLEQAPAPHLSFWLLLTLQMLASFTAAFGFAMLFSATPLSCAWAGAIAAIVNPGRIWLVEAGWAPHLAIALAVFTAGVLSEIIAPLHARRVSRISLAVPATVTMVPGVMFYMSMAHFSNGDVNEALASFVQVLLIFAALGMGLALSRLLMDKNWLYDRDTQNLASLPQGHMR
ncbi:threonine/serine exporter family protein [Rothia sp. SD9660Na]|uniref:threonine/serine ThrE exporter family protein n=1 Tax=Rothia sp. SD9660Na TaxID=3047030 RepID=UPI0024B8C956|nr:threonine/serine exporter family protein [Rothia sp. SD9660Na]WHS51091.1 threonine/serine exporter family protein [Rothia sp. SD9660Na]